MVEWNSSQRAYNSGRTSISGGQVIEPAISTNGFDCISDINDNNPPDNTSPLILNNSTFGALSPCDSLPFSKRLYLRYNERFEISSFSSGNENNDGAVLKI